MTTNKDSISSAQGIRLRGLSAEEVLQSRALHGVNVLTPPKQKAWWMLLMKKFTEPLIIILVVAAFLSIGIAVYEYGWCDAGTHVFFEPVGIIVAIMLATMVGFYFEMKARKEYESLNQVNDETPVKVVREGNVTQVPRREVVKDDIIILETGEEVPADCELLESLNVLVNESSLTGEPQAMKTTKKEDFDSDATYPSNHLMKGTILTEGYCVGRVFAVGDSTESGQVFEAAQVEEGEPTPLNRKLNRLAKWISWASYGIAALIIVGPIVAYFWVTHHDFEWMPFLTYLLNSIMIAVTLIVVAVPEGLPMSITLSLAFSMRRLMKENTLPRTMHACETMGAASVICTDKTGTLTQNKMQVAEVQVGTIDERLMEMVATNTTANLDLGNSDNITAIGNPTEGALLLWMHTQGINYITKRNAAHIIDRLPFTTENKYMATLVQSAIDGRRMLYVKGAPEIIMRMCTLTEEEQRKWQQQLTDWQQRAMRTLAIAAASVDEDTDVFQEGKLNVQHLTLTGMFAISDPVREEVPASIQECLDAGIQVKIITGDTSGTAREIGRQIGLWTDADNEENMMTGTECATLSDKALEERVQQVKIVSRARPGDKERLVKALKRLNHVVAVTGDGTNDAPALNAADVGLSMGDGTAVAKESSDMTIQDNSFSTIANAVMWGRSLYKNIQRFILFQLTINVVACFIVLIGAFTGTESPLTVTQMLWVNLIMDTFAAIALSSLPPTHSVMNERPRSMFEPIISRSMGGFIFTVGCIFTVIMLCILLIMQHSDVQHMPDLLTFRWGSYDGLTANELSLFFTFFVMLQFWNMFNAKAFMTGHSAFTNISECKGFLFIAIIIFFGQIGIVELGGEMFNVTPLTIIDWLYIVIGTAPVLLVGEIIRWTLQKK